MEQRLFYRDQTKRFCQILERAVWNGDGREMIVYQELFDTYEKKAEYADTFFSVMEPVTLLSGQSDMLKEAGKDSISENNSDIPGYEKIQEVRGISDQQNPAAQNPQSTDLLMAFLDAPDGAKKLEILEEMKDCITDYMVDAMAISLDMEISGGILEDRYQQLIRGLRTKNRYETGRRLR